jgi:hypothetical protein
MFCTGFNRFGRVEITTLGLGSGLFRSDGRCVLKIGIEPFASVRLPHCYRVEYMKFSFIPNNTSKQDLTAQLPPSASSQPSGTTKSVLRTLPIEQPTCAPAVSYMYNAQHAARQHYIYLRPTQNATIRGALTKLQNPTIWRGLATVCGDRGYRSDLSDCEHSHAHAPMPRRTAIHKWNTAQLPRIHACILHVRTCTDIISVAVSLLLHVWLPRTSSECSWHCMPCAVAIGESSYLALRNILHVSS